MIKECTIANKFLFNSVDLFILKLNVPFFLKYCHGTDLIYTITHCSMLFPTVGWPMTSALAANLAYLYMLFLCTFFSSLYYNVVIQSTLLQYYNSLWYLQLHPVIIFIFPIHRFYFPSVIAT